MVGQRDRVALLHRKEVFDGSANASPRVWAGHNAVQAKDLKSSGGGGGMGGGGGANGPKNK